MEEAGKLDVAELNDAIDTIENAWDSFLAEPLDLKRPTKSDSDKTLSAVLALTAHTVELAGAIQVLHSQQVGHLTMLPLVRSAFECAITVQWLSQIPGATESWINEHSRTTTALTKALAKSNSPTFRDGAQGIADSRIFENLATVSGTRARNFEQICEDLNIGAEAYTYYRLTSQYSHATVNCVDSYLEWTTPEHERIRVNRTVDVPPDAWLFLTAISATWAISAAGFTDNTKALRNVGRQVAALLGTQPRLEMSVSAWVRHNAPKAP